MMKQLIKNTFSFYAGMTFRLRKLLSSLLAISFLGSSLLAISLLGTNLAHAQVTSTDPYQMMAAVSDQLFTRLKSEQVAIKSNPDYLKALVDEELMPYVNDQYAALKLLGPNLKGADKAEVKAFIGEFRAYLVTSYAQALAQYTNQKIEVESAKAVPKDRRIVKVGVDIIDSNAPKIALQFTLLKDKKTGQWKAYDMTAEGISMLSSKQAEWSGEIRRKGLPAVTKEIADLAKKSITLSTDK